MKKRTWKPVLFLLFVIMAICLGILRQTQGGVPETKIEMEAETESKEQEHPRVALTFDDGPNKTYTPVLLKGLKERGVCATFFLIGSNIEGNESLVQQMQKEGHLIGSHTYNHVQLDQISENLAKNEIITANNEIYETTGIYPVYLRPPYGAWRKDMELSVTMLPVFWDIDTLDWQSRNVSSILQIVNREIFDGAIILMHDAYSTSVEAALQIVDTLSAQGYEFVTVDRLLIS
jgi:peptidoglycan/xylan/chitin deacetylase (PgdA/CDA1 family)